ncbi:hypothetical protein [Oceanisphaera sp. IT1-181]|uniref:hypothetical protein n=1 Tax=Oceanisphaera sp. IT1-181 TaxID=3081199 RepID=UPI0029CA765C|nr:hypothetical protein [Oceanisphaera sp. IT1-181]
MPSLFSIVISAVLLAFFISPPLFAANTDVSISLASSDGEAVPIAKGSMANQQLISDASIGVAAKVATLGCSRPEAFDPWIMQNPVGQPGMRVWREKWIVSGCGTLYPVHIQFSEAGSGGANWVIESQ